MKTSDLKSKVLLVNLHISLWSARKYDRNATRQVNEMHETSETGRFNKILMKSPLLENITSVANKARTFHRDITLPWSDNNDRILSTDKYFEYTIGISKHILEMNELVDSFVSEYIVLKEKQKERLKGLFKEDDYPHPDLIKEKFGIKTVFLPIADTDDFRLNLSDSMVEMLKTQIQDELQERVKIANNDLLERAKKVVEAMIERLSIPDAKFHDTLVGNIENAKDNLLGLNFSDDAHIKKIAVALQTLIVNPDMLRSNPAFRQDICKKAKEILQII